LNFGGFVPSLAKVSLKLNISSFLPLLLTNVYFLVCGCYFLHKLLTWQNHLISAPAGQIASRCGTTLTALIDARLSPPASATSQDVMTHAMIEIEIEIGIGDTEAGHRAEMRGIEIDAVVEEREMEAEVVDGEEMIGIGMKKEAVGVEKTEESEEKVEEIEREVSIHNCKTA
jgi:hypothetical protein